MADRDSVHQPAAQGGGLETGARPYNPPLLPYEIALIEALGCTEQEYRQFVRHAQLQARVRPAEYAHIPNVVNDPLTVAIVSLVLGVASTAVSILLAPKAPALETPAKIKGKKLADQIGPTRFNQTTSFDNVSSLAEYGQPIPIPFGKRGTGADGALTGGLILAPALVWSRLSAYGAFQRFEGIYVAGEAGVQPPEIGGVRIGTAALNSLGGSEYALFWSSTNAENKLTSANKIAGTQDGASSATGGGAIFNAPSFDPPLEFGNAFCMAYTPQENTTFGVSEPIHNGTAYRFNWEIVSAPWSTTKGEDYKDTRYELIAKRRKIAGSKADVIHDNTPERGMPGVGRAYSRRMGIVAHSGTAGGAAQQNRQRVTISEGDTIVFRINGNNYRELEKRDLIDSDGFKAKGVEVNLDDLQSSADAWRTRASDLLQIGSKWIISSSVWVVEKRSDFTWRKNGNLDITLRCAAIVGVPEIGIAGTRTVEEPLGGYEGDTFNPNKHCGAAFYNLCRYNRATVRPVRRDCQVIEFGIRSQVWNRANGLCNFNAIPTPSKLKDFDRRDITLNTPVMNKYFKRTSCFSVWVRPVQAYGEPLQQWARIPRLFCVTGTGPINQYNWLRIRAKEEGYYEYRFIPRTGSDVAINSIETNYATRLNAQTGSVIGADYATPYGEFRVTVSGENVLIQDLLVNGELTTRAAEFVDAPAGVIPVQTNIPSAVSLTQTATNGSSQSLREQAWLQTLLGYAWDYKNQWREVEFTHYKPNGDREITLKVRARSLGDVEGAKYRSAAQTVTNASNSKYGWRDYTFAVVSATGAWNNNDGFTVTRNTSNAFATQEGYSQVHFQFRVSALQASTSAADTSDQTSKEERIFEQASQVSDCSHYLELEKSNEGGPEHEIVYVNEFVDNETEPSYYAMSTVGFVVKSSGQLGSVNQIRMWTPTGINVQRLIEGDTKPSNLFADLVYYLLTSKSQGVGNVVPAELIDTDSLLIAAKFQRANQIFYDGVVEDSESFRSFLYDNAALQLCNFTIKNGRFGMMPALPYDSSYRISTQPVAVEQIFTAGNIIADSLQVQYIDAAQRSNFRALVSWRVTVENDLPTQASALVDWADIAEGSRATTQQAFDLTDFCTNRAQALRTARFLLSVRRRVTHTVSFKTVPDALGIQPGSYIRVITSATTYSATNNGAITDAGTLVSISTIADGTYNAMVYNPADSSVLEREITISGNAVNDSSLYGTLFTLLSETISKGVYQVEQLTLDEDGLVNVSAVEVPVDATGASIVANDVLTESNFRVLE